MKKPLSDWLWLRVVERNAWDYFEAMEREMAFRALVWRDALRVPVRGGGGRLRAVHSRALVAAVDRRDRAHKRWERLNGALNRRLKSKRRVIDVLLAGGSL